MKNIVQQRATWVHSRLHSPAIKREKKIILMMSKFTSKCFTDGQMSKDRLNLDVTLSNFDVCMSAYIYVKYCYSSPPLFQVCLFTFIFKCEIILPRDAPDRHFSDLAGYRICRIRAPDIRPDIRPDFTYLLLLKMQWKRWSRLWHKAPLYIK